MNDDRNAEIFLYKTCRAILLYPFVVIAGLLIFVVFQLFLLPVLSFVAVFRFVFDSGFRAGVLGAPRNDQAPGEVFFHAGHTRLKVNGPDVEIGPDEFASTLVGKRISGIECPGVGSVLKTGERIWRFRCGDRAIEQLVPIAGTVVDVNLPLLENPLKIGNIPLKDLWVVRIRPTMSLGEIKGLIPVEGIARLNQEVRDRLVSRCSRELGLVAADGGEMLPNLPELLSPEDWDKLVAPEFK